MHRAIAITLAWLLLFVEQQIVSAAKQCSSDQQCVDISFCQEFESRLDDSSLESIVGDAKLWSELDALVCNVESTTGFRKFCCQVPPENKINTPACGKDMDPKLVIKTYHLFQNPWMALIRDRQGRVICSGTIIAGSFILSAASCSARSTTGGDTVRVGEFDTSKSVDCLGDAGTDCADAPIDVAVLSYLLHPQYNRATKENDVALVKTATMQFSESVRPICLSSYPVSWPFSLVGWNAVESVPRYTDLLLVEPALCEQNIKGYANGTIKMDNKMCVELVLGRNCSASNREMLRGSSVQPFSDENRSITQQGILLAISDCNPLEPTAYAVLTDVTSYMDWIEANIHYLHPKMRF